MASISPKAFAALGLMVATISAAYALGGDDGAEFRSLVPVDEAALAPETLRGIPGGHVPWSLQEGDARVADGRVDVTVRGLAVDRSGHPADGTNPMDRVFVTVSCLDRGSGNVVDRHTAPVDATEAGAADVADTLDWPPGDGCVAPVVLLRGDRATLDEVPGANPEGPDPADPWLAAGGSPTP